jgi:hypothetical protein
MRIRVQGILFSFSIAAAICGPAAIVCAGFGQARGGLKEVVSAPGTYFQYCGLFMAPVAQHVHDALLHGDKWMDLRPIKCDWMMRSGCPAMPIVEPVCIAKNW